MSAYLERILAKATEEKIAELKPRKVFKEYATTLSDGKKGAYDFFIIHNGQRIGFEVLSRPTKHKLKRKLRYLKEVDKFIFVMPSTSFSLYRRSDNAFPSFARPKKFPREFASEKLYVWLCSIKKKRITACAKFSKIFYVED